MKGIVLAGGSGTRLYPLTLSVSKQLLPVYDKPTIFYPISILMLAGIRDILIISTPRDTPLIETLLGDGSALGMKFQYKVQPTPSGIPQAFVLGADFIGQDPVTLILGDNIFFGQDLPRMLREKMKNVRGGNIFAYQVKDPERYGVVEFDDKNRVLSLEEKPKAPKSNWAQTGLFFYEPGVVDVARNMKPSARGELEITDLNRHYLERGDLHAHPLGRGIAWLDSGTYDALLSASIFVQTLEQRQGLKVACLEEIAFLMEYIDSAQLRKHAERLQHSDYGQYLARIANEPRPPRR